MTDLRIWRSVSDVPADLGRTVVTIGNFDGVHLGHQHVVRRARETATELGVDAVVAVTFDPHPMAVLRPDHAPPTLTGIDDRAALLGRAGVDAVLVLPFDREMASWTPEEFVQRVLVDALHARGGRGRRQLPLRQPGRRRRRHARARRASGTTSSSRASRSTAARRSGRRPTSAPAWPPATSPAPPRPSAARSRSAASVVEGDQRGRELGFPTANVPDRRPHRHPRRRGVRRVAAAAATPARRYPAAISRRHQPDLRRRARAPGRGLRPGPHRPRALRRRGRGLLRRAAAGDGPLRRRRRPRRDHGRRRRPGPRAAGADDDATEVRWPRSAGRGVVRRARPALLRRRHPGAGRTPGCAGAGCVGVAAGRPCSSVPRPAPLVGLSTPTSASGSPSAARCCCWCSRSTR